MNAKSKTVYRWMLWLVCIGLLTAASFATKGKVARQAETTPAPKPLWEADLTKFGFQGRPPVKLESTDTWGSALYEQGAVFTEQSVLAIFFVVHDEPSSVKAVARKPLPSDPYRLVAVFLSAERGELIRKMDWPLPRATEYVTSATFIPATEGRFIAAIGDTLQLFSRDAKLLARHQGHSELGVIASPAGDTILVQDTQLIRGQWVSRYELLATDQLVEKEPWTEKPPPNRILWGNQLAWITGDALYFKAPGAAPKALATSKKGFCGYWSFLNKETIAVLECGGDEKLVIVSTNGKVAQEYDFGWERQDGPAIASRNGRRFAVPAYEWGSGSNRNPKKLSAHVFELGKERPLLTLDVPRHYGEGSNFNTPLGDTRFGWGGVALSPDGGRLAIKSGAIVQMYSVPNAGTSTARAVQAPAQPPPDMPLRTASPPSQLVQQVLAWLPADTETVIAENGPFAMPKLSRDETGAREGTERKVEDAFAGLALGLFSVPKKSFEKYFQGETVLLSMEGSRHFRPPSGLGLGPYEGAAIVVFRRDISDRANSYMKETSARAIRIEQIQGHKVAVFQEKMEEDVWTTFVAFPKPNIAVAASNKNYLLEVLAKINGQSGVRALPDTLPEWKFVDAQAAFWAVRHYERRSAKEDPTSPFGGKKSANMPDDLAVGITFQFDPTRSKTATIHYLSSDKDALKNVQKNLFPIEHEPGAKALNIQYRQVSPGIVQGSFELRRIETAELFGFVLVMLLGHVVYI